MARANKEAVVICIDVGPGMQDAYGDSSSLQLSLEVASKLIQRKIFSQSKDEVALVLFGTQETLNQLAENDSQSYQNISVVFPLGLPNFELLEYLAKDFDVETTESDFLDALTVSLDILYNSTSGKTFTKRRIALLTNFSHSFSDDAIDGIMNGFKTEGMNVELNVIGPESFLSPSAGLNSNQHNGSDSQPTTSRNALNHQSRDTRKPKAEQQQQGEKVITNMKSNGIEIAQYSFSDAMQTISGFEKQSVKPSAWKCNLTLGTELAIPCVAYAKTKEAKLKQSWKKCHAQTSKASDVTRNQYYFVDDEQRTEVPKENLAKGYKYGKDIIPFSAEDEKQMKFTTEGKRLSILGFTTSDNVPVYLHMNDQAHIVMAEAGDEDASVALSAFALAMQNQSLCAIVSYVYRKGSNPSLMALQPCEMDEKVVLIMVALPFSEDMRPLEFPSLSANEGESESLNALGSIIDEMSLISNEDEELLRPETLLNPHFQHTYECLFQRISSKNPSDDLSSPSRLRLQPVTNDRTETLAKQLHQSYKLEKKSAGKSDTKPTWKKIENETNDEGETTATIVPLSEMNQNTIQSVGSVSPTSDFETLLSRALKQSEILSVFQQMQTKIEEFINDPFAKQLQEKILRCLKKLVEHAKQEAEVVAVNSFLWQIKATLLSSKPWLWESMVQAGIGLAGSKENSPSEDERKKFLESSTEPHDVEQKEEKDDITDETDDLLDMLE